MVYKDLEKKKAQATKYARTHVEQLKANTKKWRMANLEKYTANQLSYRINNPEKRILTIARNRAKDNGLEFSIGVEDIIIPDVCPLLNIPLHANVGKGRAGPNSPSLDRIDATKGYIKGNVWVISYRANAAKNNLSLEELETLVRNLRAKIESVRPIHEQTNEDEHEHEQQ
jgi:hypothetical protein